VKINDCLYVQNRMIFKASHSGRGAEERGGEGFLKYISCPLSRLTAPAPPGWEPLKLVCFAHVNSRLSSFCILHFAFCTLHSRKFPFILPISHSIPQKTLRRMRRALENFSIYVRIALYFISSSVSRRISGASFLRFAFTTAL